MTNYLGLDFGTSSIGIAVAYTEMDLVMPIGVMKVNQGKINLTELQNIIKDISIDALVMGLPIDQNNQETSVSKKAKKLARFLAKELQLTVYMIDERYTSADARSFITSNYNNNHKANKPNKNTKFYVDAMAAALILESFLEIDPEQILETFKPNT